MGMKSSNTRETRRIVIPLDKTAPDSGKRRTPSLGVDTGQLLGDRADLALDPG